MTSGRDLDHPEIGSRKARGTSNPRSSVEAAEAGGLGKVILLEEPQAAFYAWIAEADREWRALIGPGDIVLVRDVGGGTTDFSLIAVSDNDGTLELDRISVGEHILLGGDNMDLALAYTLNSRRAALGHLGITIGFIRASAIVFSSTRHCTATRL